MTHSCSLFVFHGFVVVSKSVLDGTLTGANQAFFDQLQGANQAECPKELVATAIYGDIMGISWGYGGICIIYRYITYKPMDPKTYEKVLNPLTHTPNTF